MLHCGINWNSFAQNIVDNFMARDLWSNSRCWSVCGLVRFSELRLKEWYWHTHSISNDTLQRLSKSAKELGGVAICSRCFHLRNSNLLKTPRVLTRKWNNRSMTNSFHLSNDKQSYVTQRNVMLGSDRGVIDLVGGNERGKVCTFTQGWSLALNMCDVISSCEHKPLAYCHYDAFGI